MENHGIKELSEGVDVLLDSLEAMLGQIKDGKKMVDEIKDLNATEGVQLAMKVMMRLPSLLDSLKKDPDNG